MAIPPSVAADAPDAAPKVVASGYGYGLFIADDLRLGRIVSHSGGYPGFGSNMHWQLASGLGVIALANHRYAPMTLLASELLAVLAEGGVARPRRLRPAGLTVAARASVERLLDAWDDGLAVRTFATNVDLDEPLTRRHTEMERLREVHGTLTPDPDEPDEVTSPFATTWWMRGELGGRVRITISLSPETSPKIQTLTITSVPEPSEGILVVAEAVAAWFNSPDEPPDLPLGRSVDREAVERTVRSATARYGHTRLGPPTAAADGATTFRVIGERGELNLRIALDNETGNVSTLELRSAPLVPPPHAD